MQAPSQAPQYIVLRADHFPLFSIPEVASLLIREKPLFQTPDAAKEAFIATFGVRGLLSVTENYVVVEVTQNRGRYILKKHSDLTAAQINTELWQRSLKPQKNKVDPQVIQNILRQYNVNASPLDVRPRGNPSPEQLAQLFAQLGRDAAIIPQALGNPLSPSAAAPPSPVRFNPPQPAVAASPAPMANLPPQPAAASPLPVQIMNPFWGKPAAQAAAAPSPHRRDEHSMMVDLSAMKRFLGMTDELFNSPIAKRYFATLQQILPGDFFQQNADRQFNWIMNNRRNESLYPALKSNPPLACLFLDKIVAGNPQHRSLLTETRFGRLYVITDILDQREFKRRYGHLENAVQIQKAEQIYFRRVERLRLQMLQLQAERARARQPLLVPEVKEGQRTQIIHELHDKNKLSRPIEDNLRCMLTGRLFQDPVKLTQEIEGVSHTFYFERSQILFWHSSKRKPDGTALNPFNNVPFKIEELQEAPEMVAKLAAFKDSVDADVAAHAREHPSPAPTNPPIPKSPST
jgi:hypothetical protein